MVVVGGGYGGTRVAYRCRDRGNFSLIDPKEAMHHNIAALRYADLSYTLILLFIIRFNFIHVFAMFSLRCFFYLQKLTIFRI